MQQERRCNAGMVREGSSKSPDPQASVAFIHGQEIVGFTRYWQFQHRDWQDTLIFLSQPREIEQ